MKLRTEEERREELPRTRRNGSNTYAFFALARRNMMNPAICYRTTRLRLHVVLSLLLVELTFLFRSGVLVLLVLRHQIVHVGLSLGELHLVHALAGVPVKEGLAAEHASELLGHTLPELLDGGGVAKEHGGHLETLGWDVTHGGLDVVGDPLDEVARVLVLDVEHLLVNLLGGHAATEEGGAGEVAAMTRIGGAHHVLPC